MVTTSDSRPVSEIAGEWAEQLRTHGPVPTLWQQDQPPPAAGLGGQLHGRPYVGPPTEPSRAVPSPPPTDVVARAYHIYSESLAAACQRFRMTQDAAWQDYTRTMQDANAAYEVEIRRAGLALDGEVSRYTRGQ